MNAPFARVETALAEAEAYQRRARSLQRKKVELAYRFLRVAAELLADELVGDEVEQYDSQPIAYEVEREEEEHDDDPVAVEVQEEDDDDHVPTAGEVEDENDDSGIADEMEHEERAEDTHTEAPPAEFVRCHAHKKRQRSKRRVFDHAAALKMVQQRFVGPQPEFDDQQFSRMFGIRRSRFRRLLDDFMDSAIAFYGPSRSEKTSASVEAKLLFPLKTLVHGVATNKFADEFQLSPEYARSCCSMFDTSLRKIYADEYLRPPTATDLQSIEALHQRVHGVQGMLGSLGLSRRLVWKNCPTTWRAKKGNTATIVAEAMCDSNLWFWYVACGYSGTKNDDTSSSLLESFVDGSFFSMEKQSNVVPFSINGQEFSNLFCLVSDAYPAFHRFVKSIHNPRTEMEVKYTAWQERAHQDIQRAFMGLQDTFQFMCTPIELHNPVAISERIATCILLHNMNVADRVHVGDCHATYQPSLGTAVALDDDDAMSANSEIAQKVDPNADFKPALYDRWNSLVDTNTEQGHARLQDAIMARVGAK